MTKHQTPLQIEETLVRENGPLLSGERLWRTLGFTSGAAFRQAKAKGRLAVEVFDIESRRGTFAYTSDVAAWLVTLKGKEVQPKPK